MKKKLTLLIVLMIILSSTAIAQTTIEPYIIIPEEYRSWNEKKTSKDFDRTNVSENGMVASSKYEASLVGLRVLQDGGNAVDSNT